MKQADKSVLYFETGPTNPVTLSVAPGEEFEVETQINAGPWIDESADPAAERARLRGANPASGCIEIEGAAAGQVLAIHIDDIRLSTMGFTHFGGANGAMPSWFGATGVGEHWKIVAIEGGRIEWEPGLSLQARPMIGFVGVAPPFESFSNARVGYWGGNFDVQEITTGATVYLPVYVPGARLHVGDMHAIQGDGEICGAGGIETEGVVRLRCELYDAFPGMLGPWIEDDTHLICVGCARPAEDAFRLAVESLVVRLETVYGYTRGDAYLLLGQVLEARATQFVNPVVTYVAKVAKRFIRSDR